MRTIATWKTKTTIGDSPFKTTHGPTVLHTHNIHAQDHQRKETRGKKQRGESVHIIV